MDGARIRPRIAADLDPLERLAHEVHERDGYPPRLARGFRAFVESPTALAAWVAVCDEGVVGHVCLNPTSSREVVELAVRALGVGTTDAIGVVARLFVAPHRRRVGLGERLLATATDEARRRRLTPVLDVGAHFTAAHALYEAAGWRHVGDVTVAVGDGRAFDERVYAAPVVDPGR